ncbi:MAG: tetraacyldisaccharide 4'-kinase [Bacteroidota bacterium]
MRRLLVPASWLYGMMVAVRNRAFDIGLLPATSAGVPVISVGNLTAGGTGKTPLVGEIVGRLLAKGKMPAVVSRGYGRRSRGVVVVSRSGTVLVDAAAGGDEPVQIAGTYPGASVVVGERRADAAAIAVKECRANAIVMDDGFQHRHLRRDLDIVVLDARVNIRREPLLPAGTRREWLSALRRASLLVFTRVEGDELPAWSRELPLEVQGKTALCRNRIAGFCDAGGGAAGFPTGRVLAFSGIGDHVQFIRTLKEAGVELAGELRFGDHHIYTRREAAGIVRETKRLGCDAIITTEKDHARLAALPDAMDELRRGPPLRVARLALSFTQGSETLERMIDECLERGAA